MIRPNWKTLLIGVAAVGLLMTFTSEADAFWGWRYGGCCGPYYSYSCYTPCYSTCYIPCYSTCYSPCCGYGYGYYVGYRRGPIRRWLFGPYRWYRGYYGYYGSCWNACCTDLCCSDVACCTSTTSKTFTPDSTVTPTPAVKKPVEPAAPIMEPSPDLTPEPAAPAPVVPSLEPTPDLSPAPAPGDTRVPTRANSGLLTVWVPYDAKVTVNGLPTKSQGSRRQFVSHGLKPGFSYKYVVRAEVVRNGRVIADAKTVVLTAGDRTALAFGFNALPSGSLAAR